MLKKQEKVLFTLKLLLHTKGGGKEKILALQIQILVSISMRIIKNYI